MDVPALPEHLARRELLATLRRQIAGVQQTMMRPVGWIIVTVADQPKRRMAGIGALQKRLDSRVQSFSAKVIGQRE